MVGWKLQQALDRVQPVDQTKIATVQSRIDRQAKPKGSLGRLEEFASRFVAITGREDIRKKRIVTFAADHGVAEEGVSAFPREVTVQMVRNFIGGGAAINALARYAAADIMVIDMGVNHDFEPLPGLINRKIGYGTANFTLGPAMSREQAVACLETGIEQAELCGAAGYDLVATGDMGIANTTPSAAITAVLCDAAPAQVTHRGTGIDDSALRKKVEIIARGLEVNRPDPSDPVDVLSKVGGFEIGGIAGLILGCAAEGIPVVVDGFISTAGALIASQLNPVVRDYLFAAHRSMEIGHQVMLDKLGATPMLDLKMRLGEGTGAALAMTLIEAALQALREILTFDQAGVSEGSDQ